MATLSVVPSSATVQGDSTDSASGVTTVANRLKDNGLISYRRGVIKVIDRKNPRSAFIPLLLGRERVVPPPLSVGHGPPAGTAQRVAIQDARAD